MIGVLSVSDIATIALVSFIVLVLPGVAFVYVAGGKSRPLTEWLVLAFGTSVSVAAVLSDLVNRFGGNVVWLFGILAGLAFAAAPIGWLRPVPHVRRNGRDYLAAIVIVLAIGAAILASWEGLALTRTADTFYHLEAPRSLLVTASTRVTDPFFGNKALPPDATAGTWPSVIAPIALISGIDILPIARVLAPLLAFLLVVAFYALARRFGAPSYGALIATIAFIVGATSLEFRNIVYPSRIAPIVWWAGLMWLIEWLELGGRRRAVVAALCLIAAATMHLSVAEAMLLALVITVIVAATWRAKGTVKLVVFSLVVALLFFAVAWPSLAPLGSSKTFGLSGVDREDARSQVPVLKGPFGLVIVTGEGLPDLGLFALFFVLAVGVLLWLRDARHRQAHRAPPVAMAMGLPVLLLNGVLTGALVERFWYHLLRLLVVFRAGPYVSGSALLPDRVRWRGAAHWLRALYVVIALLLIGLGFTQGYQGLTDRFGGTDVAVSFAYNRANDRSVALAGLVTKLARAGARPDTMIATPMLSLNYELAGLTGYRVIAVPASHLPAAVSLGDGPQRLADAKALYDSATPSVQRARLLAKYDVRLAVVPEKLAQVFTLAGWHPISQVGHSIFIFARSRR